MLSSFARHVQSTIRKYRMLAHGDRILVGVSGGADSVSALLALVELGHSVAAAHLNHGLRGADADGDERFAGALAAGLGIPFFSRKIALGAGSGNLEAAGRAARAEFFWKVAADSGFTRIALGHTRDDRVETFLLHLMRGAGAEGLVSMAPVAGNSAVNAVKVVRPLVELGRQDVEAYLRSRHQDWRTDASNLDVSLARNRMRHIVIPELAHSFNPRLIETLARTIEALQDEDGWMRQTAREWLLENTVPETDAFAPGKEESGKEEMKGIVGISSRALATAPVPLARRVIREALRQAGSSLTDVTYDHIEQIRALVRDGKSGKTVQIPGDMVALREFEKIIIRRPLPPPGDFSYDLLIPGSVRAPELGKVFRAEIVDRGSITPGDDRVFVDGGSLGPCVRIRNWHPGDYYRPAGWPSGKLKKLFQRARIPRGQRSRWPVFDSGGKIVWVASFPVSREFALSGNSLKIVAFETAPG